MERFIEKLHLKFQTLWDHFERDRIQLHPSRTVGFDLMDEDDQYGVSQKYKNFPSPGNNWGENSEKLYSTTMVEIFQKI